jgi:hypothetical protein
MGCGAGARSDGRRLLALGHATRPPVRKIGSGMVVNTADRIEREETPAG